MNHGVPESPGPSRTARRTMLFLRYTPLWTCVSYDSPPLGPVQKHRLIHEAITRQWLLEPFIRGVAHCASFDAGLTLNNVPSGL